EIGIALAAFFPRIALTASGGLQSSELSKLFEWKSAFWQIGANAAQPIFTGGRNTAELKIQEARYSEAIAGYRQQVLVAFKDVEDALNDLRFLGEQGKALADATAAARAVTTLATQRYDAGVVSYLDVVEAQRTQL